MDYRLELKKIFREKKSQRSNITLQKMATHIGVQGPYLSKVFSCNAHMNQDQLYLACDFLKLNEYEEGLLFLAQAHTKSSLDNRKRKIEEKISVVRDQSLIQFSSLSSDTPSAQQEVLAEFFSDPYLDIVYSALSLSRFNRAPALLVEEGLISKKKLEDSLKKLISMEFIDHNESGYQIRNDISPTSFSEWHCQSQHQENLRRMGALRQQLLDNTKPATTFLFSSSHETCFQIHKEFTQLLQKFQPLIQTNPKKEMFQLNFELFPWTKEL